MKEISRFVRYVVPGLSTALVFALMFVFTDVSTMPKFPKADNLGGIGYAIAVLLVSGVLGYILSNIYFAVAAIPGIASNHLPTIKALTDSSHSTAPLKILGIDDNPVEISDERAAWEIVASYNRKIESGEKGSRYMELIDRLVDVTHGNGAAIVGLIFSLIIWFSIYYSSSKHEVLNMSGREALVILGCIFLIIIEIINFRRTRKSLQRIGNSEFVTYIKGNKHKNTHGIENDNLSSENQINKNREKKVESGPEAVEIYYIQ